jgi:hypothetical protein
MPRSILLFVVVTFFLSLCLSQTNQEVVKSHNDTDKSKKIRLEVRPRGTVLTKYNQSIDFEIILINSTSDTIIAYNFFDDWTSVWDSIRSPGGYSPGFGGGLWNPGINIKILNIKGKLVMRPFPMVSYVDPEVEHRIELSYLQKIKKSRIVLPVLDSVKTIVKFDTGGFLKLKKGEYLLTIYYEMNNQILHFVPKENKIFFGRVESNPFKLIVK